MDSLNVFDMNSKKYLHLKMHVVSFCPRWTYFVIYIYIYIYIVLNLR
jgi:hypothetical protein